MVGEIVTATPEDLAVVLAWLEREYEADGEGFWCNRGIIERAQGEDLWVVRRDGVAAAFQVGDYAADIVSVRKDFRRQGLGDALFAASLERAARDNVNVLSIECTPRTSWTFWRRHGFQRYGDLSEWGKITARRVLSKSFDVPGDLPSVDVVVGFYPEAAGYGRGEVAPVAEHHVRGVRLEDGTVLLERRVIGLCDAEPEGKDLVVRIGVDGALRCFCKAKYEEAGDAGVTRDWKGANFYLDAVEPL